MEFKVKTTPAGLHPTQTSHQSGQNKTLISKFFKELSAKNKK